MFGSLKSVGCDWDVLVVAHMDQVSRGAPRVGRVRPQGRSVAERTRLHACPHSHARLTPQLHHSDVDDLYLPYPAKRADLHIPYLIRPDREGLDDGIKAWAGECGAQVVDEYTDAGSGERKVVFLNPAHADGGSNRGAGGSYGCGA